MRSLRKAYKVDAHNELRFAPVVAFHFGHSIVRVRALGRRRPRAVAVAMRLSRLLLLLQRVVAGRRGLLVELLLVLRGVGVPSSSVDRRRRRRHGRGGSLRLRVAGRAQGIVRVRVLVARRAAQRLLTVGIHGAERSRRDGSG